MTTTQRLATLILAAAALAAPPAQSEVLNLEHLESFDEIDMTAEADLAAVIAHAAHAVVQLRFDDDLPSTWEHPDPPTEDEPGYAGVGFCSGAFVAQDLVLTAAHCLDTSDDGWPKLLDGSPVPLDQVLDQLQVWLWNQYEYVEATDTQFGPFMQASHYRRVEAVVSSVHDPFGPKLTLYADENLDAALLRVDGADWIPRIPLATGRLDDGDRFAVIHHGVPGTHPSWVEVPAGAWASQAELGSVKQWGVGNVVDEDPNEPDGNLPYTPADHVLRVEGLTSLHGASGAPVLNEAGGLVGIWGGNYAYTGGGVFHQGSYILPIHGMLPFLPELAELLPESDYNGDGFEDLAIGLPYENWGSKTDAGRVEIVLGGQDELRADERWNLVMDSASIPATPVAGDKFGFALASGDFDCDGYTDLAVGAPFRHSAGQSDSGAIAVVYGSRDGFVDGQLIDENEVGPTALAAANNRFGYALAAGDFDGDGCADLAIGVPDSDYVGPPVDGIVPEEGSCEGWGCVGQTLVNAGEAIVNLWNDPATAVVTEGAGSVVMLHGHESGLREGILETRALWMRNAGYAGLSGIDIEEDGWFGARLAAGDIDGDGFDDLVVGVPHATIENYTDAGAIALFLGDDWEPLGEARAYRQGAGDVDGVPRTDDQFGNTLAIGDLNGDGRDDVIVSTRESNDAGWIHVFEGRSNGTLATSGTERFNQDAAGFGAYGKESGDRFGAALATCDLDGDGREDLLIGVPSEELDNKVHAGAVHWVPGSADMTDADDARSFTQASAALNDWLEEGDRLGSAVACRDFDGDGFADMVVSAPREDTSGGSNAGRIHVLPGALNGPDASRHQKLEELGSGREPHDRYGSRLN